MINFALNSMTARLGSVNLPEEKNVNVTNEEMANRLNVSGGHVQQNRMIQEKRKTLDRVVKYSYQGAKVQKENEEIVRALINPNKVKQDYDDKIISIGFEYGYQPGDIFKWCNTDTYWLIYLQDLTELAYFKGDIRKCSYQIEWKNSEGQKCSSYIALEGPPEKVIQSRVVKGINLDTPNYSISFMVPKNKDTLEFFVRYRNFYLKDNPDVCWRVEGVNSVGVPEIILVSAVEYYTNDFQKDEEEKPDEGNISSIPSKIKGKSLILPKKEYEYYIEDVDFINGEWSFSDKLPIEIKIFKTDKGSGIKLYWKSNYSGQFILNYKSSSLDEQKKITVDSLF